MMKRSGSTVRVVLLRIVCFLFVITATTAFGTNVVCAESGNGVNILFSSDIHSYLDGYTTAIDGEQKNVGGVARMKTFIDEKRAENPEMILLDGGDFAMGTLYQTLFSTEALEYRLLGAMGYDATVFGNHDFDYDSKGLADMFEVAASSGEAVPTLLCCNIDWKNVSGDDARLHEALIKCGMKDYIILDRNGYKIAITGVFGESALADAPTCTLKVDNPIETVKDTVARIKAVENPDMIICISHSEKDADPTDSEDRDLAKAVPDIDVIISGHSHREMSEAEVVGNTYILSCGCYGSKMGVADMIPDGNGRWLLDNYELVTMDESIDENGEIAAFLDSFKAEIEENYLSDFGYKYDEVLAYSPMDFESVDDCYSKHTEMRLGNLLSDSYRYGVNHTPVGEENQVDVAICPAGTIRGTFYTGDVRVTDAFEAYSLGIGEDGRVGFPLLSFYLSGAELKTAAELDASLSDIMNVARLYTSGVSFSYNPHRLILNKVNKVWLSPAMFEDSSASIDDDKLYHVVCDMYTARMIDSVTSVSKGLIKIKLKDSEGREVSDFNELIVHKENGEELKTWEAIAGYLSSFPTNAEGVRMIPEYYASYHDRKIVDDSMNPKSLFMNPSKYFIGLMIIIAVIIILTVIIIRVAIRARSKRRVYGRM